MADAAPQHTLQPGNESANRTLREAAARKLPCSRAGWRGRPHPGSVGKSAICMYASIYIKPHSSNNRGKHAVPSTLGDYCASPTLSYLLRSIVTPNSYMELH